MQPKQPSLHADKLGNIAQKHRSLVGDPIEEATSAEINREARGVLDIFLQEIRANLKLFTPVSLSEYDTWAQVSHQKLEHSPASLADIFPVSEDRTFNHIWDKVRQSNSEIGKFLQEAYKNAKGKTKKERTKKAMDDLQTNMDRFAGKVLSPEDFEILTLFQDRVERFETVANIRKLNNHPRRFEMMELILSVQKFLCEILNQMRNRDKKWFTDNEAAFGEIGIVVNDKVVPSSRFLKLILHNVGEYIQNQNSTLDPITILQNAFQKAIAAKVFHQKICIFKNTDAGMVFEGVKDKVCPASAFLANLVLKEIK